MNLSLGFGLQKAINQAGAAASPPVISDIVISLITDVSFRVTCTIDPKGTLTPVLHYGETTNYGSTLNGSEISEAGSVVFNLTGLTPYTDYRIKVVAGATELAYGSAIETYRSDYSFLSICLTGDSITHGTDPSGPNYSVAELIANEIGCDQVTIAYPADNTYQQLVRWDALTNEQKQSFDYILNLNGNNIISYLSPIATSSEKYQTLMNNLIEDKRSDCKIICGTLTPAQSAYVAIYPGKDAEILANRQAMNEAIKGLGDNSVTGQDLLITSQTTDMDDGAYSLKQIYQIPADTLHPNEAGRQVIATAFLTAIKKDLQNTIHGIPISLTATALSAYQIRLNWINGSNNFDRITIERSLNGTDWTLLKTILNNIEEFTDDTCLWETIYYYRVRGKKGDQYSTYSSAVNATTLAISTILEDGNTFGLFNAFDVDTITKDGSNVVSRINDVLASGNDFVTGACSWSETEGLIFNGTTQYFKTGAKTLNLPVTAYIIFKQITWTANDRLIDGNGNDSWVTRQEGTSPALTVSTGLGYAYLGSQAIGAWGILKMRTKTTSTSGNSNAKLNDGTELSYSGINIAPSGITLCGRGGLASGFGNFAIAGLLIRKVMEDEKIYNLLDLYMKSLSGKF